MFSLFGRGYIAIVRGVPDIAYFLFFVIALDQILEWMRHKALCRDWSEPIRQGNDFVVCDAAKLPLSSAAPWVHDLYGFALAVFTFGIVFGPLPQTLSMARCAQCQKPSLKQALLME